jgi:hypothetical protein
MRRLVIVSVVVLAAGAAAAATTALAATSPPKSPRDAYRACLAKHGVTFGGSKQPSQAKIQATFKACRSLAPAGGGGAGPTNFRPTAAQRKAFQKYAACMKKHGVTFAFPGRPNGSRPVRRTQRPPQSAKFKAAQKACASLRPAFPGRPRSGGSGGA